MDAPNVAKEGESALNTKRRFRGNIKAVACYVDENSNIRCSLVKPYYLRYSIKKTAAAPTNTWADDDTITNDGAAGTGTTKLSWNLASPTITNINPNTGVNTATYSVTIRGTSFVMDKDGVAKLGVKLVRGGQEIVGTGVQVTNQETISVDFNLNGKAAGLWDVVVTNPGDQPVPKPEFFTVTSPP